jgi:CRP-like cAMP-binding protein/peroxiredoxin
MTVRRALGLAHERWHRARLAIINQTPALAGLGPDLALRLAPYVREETFKPGVAIVRQGDQGDRFYLIASGQAEVFREGPDHYELLSTIGPLDYFGERALLENIPRTATVRAQTKLRVLSIGGTQFRKSVAPYIGAHSALRARLDERAELDGFALFESLGGREKDVLLARMTTAVFEPGQVIIHEGDAHGSFYCIRSGNVEVTRQSGSAAIHLDSLGPGDFFGEVALLLNHPRNATVTAVERTQLWSLEPDAFHELLAHYFNLESTLADVARDRMTSGQLLLDTVAPHAPTGARTGEVAPDFRLDAIDGGVCQLAELRGKAVLLWFSHGWSDPDCGNYAAQLDAIESERFVRIQVVPDTVSSTRALQPGGVRHVVVCDPGKIVFRLYQLYAAASVGEDNSGPPSAWWDVLRSLDAQHPNRSAVGRVQEAVIVIDAQGNIAKRWLATPTTPLPGPRQILDLVQDKIP